MMTKIIRCPDCGRPYEFMSMYCGEQDLCPTCLDKRQHFIDHPEDWPHNPWGSYPPISKKGSAK